ncbi:DUF2384 domain-containing protein [Bradyrhizobium sp. SSUT18]|uniref:antitoxin Xre/MbcA/ParS toxin-binding domain-containing protein n=1 Tax=Bradyrhizobium sp. SSUT18 TaxID=3040602 RepID=UPI00244A2CF3|nr:antitoxin Xre/MbcA/ParS toxin-binding domain-containing protein [Bradyrhizobium sp. SSUT18]MDH2403249.1 DUF2384 domain-containing protein [Bradyrhizobium sp. SSUT18]
MPERYQVEVDVAEDGTSRVVVTDADNGRRLSGTTSDHLASQMVGVLIEDHRERREADPVDPLTVEEKTTRREAGLAAAVSAFGDFTTARLWLATPNELFENRRPLAVAAASDDGLAAVKSELAAQAVKRRQTDAMPPTSK